MNQSQGDQSTWHHSRVALFVHRVALLSSGRISSSSLLSTSPLSSSTMLSPILVQLSLNLRQHVLLIVPLWCFRLRPKNRFKISFVIVVFLAVQNSSIGDL